MPGSYWIDQSSGTVYSSGWGIFTDEELIAHATTLRADPRFAPSFRQIVDFRALDGLHVTAEAVVRVARENPFPPDARRAVVVGSDAVYGMVRMFEIRMEADPERFAIFRDIEPALEWIGLDPGTPWPTRVADETFDVGSGEKAGVNPRDTAS